ncbi:MAG TPA: hypothetical protein VFT06_04485 [Flavisolibacter sp.]|nr:hypothetical protein [Flavisolibacter sp.]
MQTRLQNTNDTIGFQLVGKFVVPVMYRMPGNVIETALIEFAVYQKENVYNVQPLCSPALKLLTDLPPSFRFSIQNENIVIERACFKELASEIMARLNQPKDNSLPQSDK